MNINFDEIITKANERKDQLQAVVRMLERVPEHAHALNKALAFFGGMASSIAALDAEGKTLLGTSLGEPLMHHRIQNVAGICMDLERRIHSEKTIDNPRYESLLELQRVLSRNS